MTHSDKRIAVTGTTGFIGRRLCARLAADGYVVRALTRARQPAQHGIEWVAGDLADRAGLERLVEGAVAVVHCAGAVRGATAAAFHGPNVDGVATLLAAIGAVNAGARLLQVSSLAARQPQLSHYAASKQTGERLVMAAPLRATIIRPPAVYGPGDRELLPLLTGLYRGRGVIPGHQGRFSLICVDDLVSAIAAWIDRPEADGGCYEVHDGTKDGYDWNEIIRVIADLRGRPVAAARIPQALLAAAAAANAVAHRLAGRAPMLTPGKVRELYFPDWTCSNGPFSERTGWRPRIDLPGGLRLTLEHGTNVPDPA